MKAAVFSTHEFDPDALTHANEHHGHELTFLQPRLDKSTAQLAQGYPAVVAFVNDRLDAETLGILRDQGTQLVALRSAGFNNVDLAAARRLGLHVVRVPSYSPHCVAEHVFALLLALVRHIPQAYTRVRDGNFSVERLVGFELYGKTFAIIGTGRIGRAVARIAHGFGCKLVAFDARPASVEETDVPIAYLPLAEIAAQADILSLHAPLTPTTLHMINGDLLAKMKSGAILINTGRGALVDTNALIAALKAGRLGGVGLDVYEQEESFYLSDKILTDDVLARLLTFHNALITSHMGFLTREALADIGETTLASLSAFERQEALVHEVGLGGSGARKSVTEQTGVAAGRS